MPENSIAAAEAAIAAGLGIECDIQRSADDVAMVFHDWNVERLTGEAGEIGALSAEELHQLQYSGSDQRPAPLRELLSLIDGRAPLLIEIKSKPGYDVECSCEIVAQDLASYSGDVAIMSFDPRVAAWVREHSPSTCCGLVMREDEHGYTQTAAERWEAFEHAQPDFLAYHIAALPNEWVVGLRADGLPILSWTVNSPETRQLALAHVDALVSEGAGLP